MQPDTALEPTPIPLQFLRQSQRPICTSPGIFLTLPDSSFPALRPHSMRAFSSVAISSALNGILFAFKIVSIRDVAVTMWDDPEVREVYR